ncbi:DUF3566 domain-containing protein [Zhihengliuella sp.]|uniref:DUF3566 domain-containing protein n=1 Tax=Zhihengliuella sp. TaxID=1954483 RepID=UPI0035C03D5F
MSTPNTPRPGSPRPEGSQAPRTSGEQKSPSGAAGQRLASGSKEPVAGKKPGAGEAARGDAQRASQPGEKQRPESRPASGKPTPGRAPAATGAPASGAAKSAAGKPAPQRPQQQTGQQRPQQATGQQRPAGQRPAGQQGAGQQKLVRPAPKAKVRKARLLVSRVDPWSVLKLSFLLSVALGIVTVVAAVVLWTVLDLTGVFDSVNSLLTEIAGSESGFSLADFASLGQIAAFATIVAVVNVVLITAISTLAAVLYNISSSLVGGIGVTLTDD